MNKQNNMNPKNIKHIAIAGNIGSGKTTLCELLSKHYNWRPHYESVDDNPYLTDFYDDMQRWSFNLQVYFLNSRFKQIIDIQRGDEVIIQDRTIYEDVYIFAPNLHEMGLMNLRDYENYKSLFETMNTMISAPDLLIYLKAGLPTLVRNIEQRGREYEDNIRLDYLKKLNLYYENWISSYNLGKLLIIDVDDMNIKENPEDLAVVIDSINKEINGLF